VPKVLTHCSDFIETRGIVDGIYRLSGGHQISSSLHSWAPYLFTSFLSPHTWAPHISHFYVFLSSQLGTTLLHPVFYPPLLIVGHYISSSPFYPLSSPAGPHISEPFLFSPIHSWAPTHFIPFLSSLFPTGHRILFISSSYSWAPHLWTLSFLLFSQLGTTSLNPLLPPLFTAGHHISKSFPSSSFHSWAPHL
jgi:hypothetical protein